MHREYSPVIRSPKKEIRRIHRYRTQKRKSLVKMELNHTYSREELNTMTIPEIKRFIKSHSIKIPSAIRTKSLLIEYTYSLTI